MLTGTVPAPDLVRLVDNPLGADLANVSLRHGVRTVIDAGPAAPGAPLPDLIASGSPHLPRKYLEWAQEVLSRALDRPIATHAPVDELLRALVQQSLAWPRMVGAPLRSLVTFRSRGQFLAATLYARDTVEALVRLLWMMLIHRAWVVVAGMPGRPANELQHAATSLLTTIRTHSFSFGVAAHTASSRLHQPLWECGGAPLPPMTRTQWRHLYALKQWRNDLAHGTCPAHDEAGPALERPLARIVELMTALAPWLAEAARWGDSHGWPRFDNGAARPARWTPRPEPIVWADPSCGFWVLERVLPSGLLLRDLGSNRTTTLDSWPALDTLLRHTAPRSRDQTHQTADIANTIRPDGLVDDAVEAIRGGARVWLRGHAGSGKTVCLSWICNQLADEGYVVLRVAPAGTGDLTPEDIRGELARALRDSDLHMPTGPGIASALPVNPRAARAWWAALVAQNPSAKIVIAFDGIDRCTDRATAAAWVRVDNVGGIATTRGAAPIEPRARAIDVDAFYNGSGLATLGRYLKRVYPALKEHHRQILALSRGRFAWVHHYAVGLGHAGVMPDTDPAKYYEAYTSWLEQRVGHHGGYVQCLRVALIALAETGGSVSEATLAQLIAAPEGQPEAWADWLPAVLNDVRDMLSEQAIEAAGEEAWIIHGDSRGFVVGIAHEPLARWLTSEQLPSGWTEARLWVRARLAAHCQALTTSPTTNAQRFALIRGIERRVAGGDSLATAVEEALECMPPENALWVAPTPDLWVLASRARLVATRHVGASARAQASIQLASALIAARRPAQAVHTMMTALSYTNVPEETRDRMLEMASNATSIEGRPAEALALARRIRANAQPLLRIRCKTLEGWCLQKLGQVNEAVACHQVAVAVGREAVGGGWNGISWDLPELVRSYALALDGWAHTLTVAGDPSALDLFAESQPIWRRLARTGQPGPLRDLGIALRRFGHALRVFEPERAPAVHEEEVAIARGLLPSNALLEAIARDRPQAARDLAIALENLGRARLAVGDTARAIRAHTEVVRWFRASVTDSTHTTTWERPRAAALRDLAYALTALARALAHQRSAEAATAVDEARRLLLLAWGLPTGARAAEGPSQRARLDLARVTVHEAEACAALGEPDRARALLAEFEALGEPPDPDMVEAIASCRALLDAHSA